MATMPQKIVLKSTTKMSLNERFSAIAEAARPNVQSQDVRLRMASLNQMSARNKRENIQMANRSLSMMIDHNEQVSNVRDRLGPVSALQRLGPRRGRFRGAGRPFVARGIGSYRGRGSFNNFAQNNQFLSPRSRGRPFRGFRGRGGGRGTNPYFAASTNRGRGGNVGRRFVRGRGRGLSRGAGRGGHRGRGRGNATPMTREQLDSQMDEYMAKTPARLNADLDQYMADDN